LRLLLDTHAFLWFVLDDPKLTPPARRAIESASNEVCISPASYWEIAIKMSLGKYRLNGSSEGFWDTGLQQNDIAVLPIEVRHAAKLATMPFHHKDPSDGMLVAQALAEHVTLVSADPRLDAYGVSRLW
jgi:PIN domain nuclease of toxin-antitoxin system